MCSKTRQASSHAPAFWQALMREVYVYTLGWKPHCCSCRNSRCALSYCSALPAITSQHSLRRRPTQPSIGQASCPEAQQRVVNGRPITVMANQREVYTRAPTSSQQQH